MTACPSSIIYVGARDAQERRHGEGAGVLGNGDLYKGQWRADKPEGKGALVSLAHRDVFEGEVTTATGKGAAAADDGSQVEWKAGRWSTLQGWRIEAAKWLRPRVPQDFVTVISPLPPEAAFGGGGGAAGASGRSKVEALYRVRNGVAKREDTDVRVAFGGGRRGYRGSVWPWDPERDGGGSGGPLLSVPRPRMGLEWAEQEDGGLLMREAEFDERGEAVVVRMTMLRRADGTREYGGEVMAIMDNQPKVSQWWNGVFCL